MSGSEIQHQGNQRRTLSVLVEDVPGVLSKVSGLFARRAFNIHSLAVGPSEHEGLSRITVVVDADPVLVEQITKQLHKLINVIKVTELDAETSVQREHVLIKLRADAPARLQVTQAAELFRARVVDVSAHSLMVEATGDSAKLKALLRILEPFGVIEIVSSGALAMNRGRLALSDKPSKN